MSLLDVDEKSVEELDKRVIDIIERENEIKRVGPNLKQRLLCLVLRS